MAMADLLDRFENENVSRAADREGGMAREGRQPHKAAATNPFDEIEIGSIQPVSR